jgi:hypothetical protein
MAAMSADELVGKMESEMDVQQAEKWAVGLAAQMVD